METQNEYCKKIIFNSTFKNEFADTVLFGLILSEDDLFIEFKTAKRTYKISRRCIISIQDTDRIFRSESQ
jgi:hypothetical protein